MHGASPIDLRNVMAGDGGEDRLLAGNEVFEVVQARTPRLIAEAMALRHRVFVGEMGACCADPQFERDDYDPFCVHVVVRVRDGGEVVGACRILLPERAAEVGCLYTDGEFWLTRLAGLRPQLAELGRTCVAPEHRDGLVIRLLWAGVQVVLSESSCRWLIGAVSVPLAGGLVPVARIAAMLGARCPAPDEHRVWPRRRLDLAGIDAGDAPAVLPPLIKSYVRMGARLLGEPHFDPEFGTADFPMMIDLAELDPRLLRRLGPGQATTGSREPASAR